jgi:hypothetical protein
VLVEVSPNPLCRRNPMKKWKETGKAKRNKLKVSGKEEPSFQGIFCLTFASGNTNQSHP